MVSWRLKIYVRCSPSGVRRTFTPVEHCIGSTKFRALPSDSDAISLLRDGLGIYDMEVRWMAHLDEADVLRLWRSWTGNQIYEARVTVDRSGTSATFAELKVEQHPDSYTGRLSEEPALFERVLISTVDHLRHFRAGHTPYGPSPSAGPVPDPWPSSAFRMDD